MMIEEKFNDLEKSFIFHELTTTALLGWLLNCEFHYFSSGPILSKIMCNE